MVNEAGWVLDVFLSPLSTFLCSAKQILVSSLSKSSIMYKPSSIVAKFPPEALAFVDPSEATRIFSQVSPVLYTLVQKPVSLCIHVLWLIVSLETNVCFF